MKKILLFTIALLGTLIVQAQNVGIGTSTPDPSARLEIDDSNRGLLIPRVTLTSNTDAVTIPSPARTLLIYHTGSAGLPIPGYYYNAGTPMMPNWVMLSGDDWRVTGNAGTNPTNNFIGTTDAVDFVTRTNNTERMRVTSGGNVGIGIAVPTQRLHVSGGSILTDRAYAASTLTVTAGAVINIAQPATQVRITNDGAAAANNISYTATAIEGQYLWITNNDADVATFSHTATLILPNRTMCFVYVGGAWREVFAFPPVSVTANNGLYVFGGNTVRLGGNLLENTTITNNGFNLQIAGTASTTTFTTAGNVGIGIAAPTQKLHVSGGSILTDRAYAASTLNVPAGAAINIAQPATQVRITDDGAAAANAITYSATAIEGQYLWITNNDAQTATFASTNIPANSVVGFVYTNGTWRPVRAPGIGDDWRLDGNTNGVLRYIGTNDNFDFPIRTNGTERMRVTAGGNVGIATTTPSVRLHVASGDLWANRTIRATAPSDGTNAGIIELYNETNNRFWHITHRSGDADKLIFWRNNGAWADVLTLTMEQRVGIATTAPNRAMLEVNGM
ncbi:MAG: hypothetical protein NZ108_08120, partial [Bacteroidia bacterium]|nr:hypothetical protein [Bacteroidia bacterium]